MKTKKLTYIMDPHCGWSYANERSVKDLFDYFKDEYEFEVICGGMWTGNHQRKGGEAMYDFILPNVIRINQFYNVEISGSYLDLIKDQSYLLSSEWPSRAINAVSIISPKNVLEYTYKLMEQQFQHGKRYDVERTYIDALEGLEIDVDEFKKKWTSSEVISSTEQMFKQTRKYTSTYPSLILQHEMGFRVINRGVFKLGEVINDLQKLEESLV